MGIEKAERNGQYFVDLGLFEQLKLYSRTSAYRQIVWTPPSPQAEGATKEHLRAVVDRIKDGSFAQKWTEVQENGMAEFKTVDAELRAKPFWQEEVKLYKRLKRL